MPNIYEFRILDTTNKFITTSTRCVYYLAIRNIGMVFGIYSEQSSV